MGLDNGICVRRTFETNKIEELKVFNEDYDKEFKYDFSVTYWRKCWNIRNDIFGLGIGYDESYYTNLTEENIEQIIELLESYNDDNWYDGGSCIWEFTSEEEGWSYSEHIKQDIESLKLLRQLMYKYELEVYFYDSY
jgi:hypothetical protein